MIPDNQNFKVRELHSYFRDGILYTEYAVLVPDSTISGDYRHEHVVTRQVVDYVRSK